MRKPRDSRGSARVLFLFVLLGTAISLSVGYSLVQHRIQEPGVRQFVETKAAEVLGVPVTVGSVRFFPPAGVRVEGLQIGTPPEKLPFSVVQVKQLTFGYGPLNLFQRNLQVPTHVEVRDAKVWLRSPRFFGAFFETSFSHQALPGKFVIRQGEFHWPWGTGGEEFVLSQVELSAQLDFQGKIRLQGRGRLGGAAEGTLEIRGTSDPKFRDYELEILLKDVNFLSASGVPLKEVRGKFFLDPDRLEWAGVTSLLHPWEIKSKGKIENWRTVPRLSLEAAHESRRSPFRFSVEADFQSTALEGVWSWRNRDYPFRGQTFLERRKILFSRLELPHEYSGSGEIDLANGDYEFHFERDRRRLQLRSNWNRLEFETEFQLDHVSVGGLDWVVLGRARVTPLPETRGSEGLRFRAGLETDYFILEYEPLEDFRGSFVLSSQGIREIDFEWGGTFHLGGQILFQGSPFREDLVVRVDRFPLDSVKEFSGRPVPSNLSGVLAGKLKLRGEVRRPEVQGYFTITDGSLEKLEFDQAVIQFRGFPPYLPLYDSKIFRGRNRLKLTGAVDLGLENVFHGIQIKGPDSLVLWKGISVGWQKDKALIQAERPLASGVVVGLQVGTGSSDTKEENQTAASEGERSVVVGPRVKF